MAQERTENIVYQNSPKGEGLRYIIAEVKKADQNDTVVFADLTHVKDCTSIRLDTGAEVTCSEGTNIVTLDGAAIANTPMMILVSGW